MKKLIASCLTILGILLLSLSLNSGIRELTDVRTFVTELIKPENKDKTKQMLEDLNLRSVLLVKRHMISSSMDQAPIYAEVRKISNNMKRDYFIELVSKMPDERNGLLEQQTPLVLEEMRSFFDNEIIPMREQLDLLITAQRRQEQPQPQQPSPQQQKRDH